MRHDWVFEVLADLAEYADRNGLPRLAQIAEEALQVARDEIRSGSGGGDDPGPDDSPQVH
ncbi:hypothetical protein [Paragemmobacter ruber]|uniref:Uncharacterized protein n=1 Tax=Paragemmobacter ruber TaxID=1985673 RepID=A0ABW9Y5W6_9RHOB|nr:hypothetical protein [Rhodobacter ruber]NBE07803.1 hypothetical protein [Rhodobacter ruber]